MNGYGVYSPEISQRNANTVWSHLQVESKTHTHTHTQFIDTGTDWSGVADNQKVQIFRYK